MAYLADRACSRLSKKSGKLMLPASGKLRKTFHPHMSMHDRAAQFAPFAALTGHDAAIEDITRLTEEQADQEWRSFHTD